jgi:hypothetical protein
MSTTGPRSTVPQAAWLVLMALHAVGIGVGVLLFGYALIPLRAEKLEVVYRVENVPFMAGPQGVAAEKWERMTAVHNEVVEPMANWVQYAGIGMVALSMSSMLLVWRLRPAALGGDPEATTLP